MERNIVGSNDNSCTNDKEGVGLEMMKKARPQEQLNCPRCNSTNTKFCYYNNYSLTQPRYFCKTCRRYWTEGGSLRNVPVGGGSRKNKKLFTTNNPSSSSSSPKLLPDLNPTTTTNTSSTLPSSSTSTQNPKLLMQGGQDLNLAFPPMMENYDHHHHLGLSYQSSSSSSSSTTTSALELLRAGMTSSNSRGLSNNNPFVHSPILMMPNSNNVLFPSGFGPIMHEVKPSLGFSVDNDQGLRSRYGVHHQENNNNNVNGGGGRLLFPFGDVKQIPRGAHHEVEGNNNNKEHAGNSSSGGGYWTGMIGEGSW